MAISKVLKVSLGCAVGVLGVLFTVEAARDFYSQSRQRVI